MSAAKKFSVQIGQIKIKTDNKTAAKALLAYSLQEAGVISISRPAANAAQPSGCGRRQVQRVASNSKA